MNLSKRKYSREEVENIVKSLTDDYEERLKSQKNRISSLLSENIRLTSELGEYEDKERLIISTLKDAEEKAEELKENAGIRYSLVVGKLRNFSARWEKYFSYITDKYPYYPEVKKASETMKKVKEILGGGDDEKIVVGADEILRKAEGRSQRRNIFDPKSKIEAFIAAEGDNGFNLDEVLHPGELKLEDLCKELGLTEED